MSLCLSVPTYNPLSCFLSMSLSAHAACSSLFSCATRCFHAAAAWVPPPPSPAMLAWKACRSASRRCSALRLAACAPLPASHECTCVSIERPCRHAKQACLGRVQLRAQRGLRSARCASLVRSRGLLRHDPFCQNSQVALQGCALTPHLSQQHLVLVVRCRGCLARGGKLLACLQQPARLGLAIVTCAAQSEEHAHLCQVSNSFTQEHSVRELLRCTVLAC